MPKPQRIVAGTPIRQCPSIGPTCGAELESIGIRTYGDLKKLGWERTYAKLTLRYPRRLNAIYAWVLLGTLLQLRYRQVPEEIREKGRALSARLKKERGIGKRPRIVEVTPRNL